MSDREFDVCIIGQGLAGTTLAWTLLLRKQRILVIDHQQPVTASSIAAGLITPITGPKLAKTWGWDEARERCEQFYTDIERLTRTRFFATRPAVHLLRTAVEAERWQKRLHDPAYLSLARPLEAAGLPAACRAPYEGFEMPAAAWLHVPRYLAASREHFQEAQAYLQAEFAPTTDLAVTPDEVLLPRLRVRTKRVIFCQGFTHTVPECWAAVRFQPAKGEILSVRIPAFHESRSLHAGVWLAPQAEGEFRLGATFDWAHLDQQPTQHGQETLLRQLGDWLPLPVEIIDHRAAVRPTMRDFKPVLGLHPDQPRLGILNGLGTRGSLLAPWLAELLADHLEDRQPLPAELDVRRWFR